jgi:Domain of unknown function (DUF4331)
MKTIPKIVLTSMALLISLFSRTKAHAADHVDGPRATIDPAADITDIYAFMSPDPAASGHLVLIMSVAPLASAMTQFSDKVDYVFRIRKVTNPNPLILGPPLDVSCKYASSVMTCTAPQGRKASAVMGEMSGLTSDDIRLFVGPRSDSFFFDLAAFRKTAATGTPAFTNPGANFFQGSNVLSIVVEINVETVFGKGAILAVAGETRRIGNGGQQ